MKDARKPKSLRRREFLKVAGLAGGAAGIAAAAGAPAGAKKGAPDGGKGSAYRETEHVKKYYDSARF
jgi:hypothetical protein